MKGLSYVVLSKYPSGYTQQGGPASAAIVGQTGSMLQMQLEQMNNNINAIKEGAEQPFFLANGLVFLPAVGSSVFTYGMPNITHYGYLRETVISGSRSGSNSNGFQVKSVSHTHYQLDFGAQSKEGGQNGDGWGLSFYTGVPIISSPLVHGAGFTPGPFVVTPPGVQPNTNPADRDFIRHEIGHVATFFALGASFPLYLTTIALPSAINYHFPNQFGGFHDEFYTEKLANTFSDWLYGPFTGPYKNTYPSYNTPKK